MKSTTTIIMMGVMMMLLITASYGERTKFRACSRHSAGACTRTIDLDEVDPATRGQGNNQNKNVLAASNNGNGNPNPNNGNRPTKVAVVGMGLAGLTTAYRLMGRDKIELHLFEGSTRAGGRVQTRRFLNGEGPIFEAGGELVDTVHTDMLDLLADLNIGLDDLGFKEDKEGSYSVRDPDNLAVRVTYTHAEAQEDYQRKKTPQTLSVEERVRADAWNTWPSGFDVIKQPWPMSYNSVPRAIEIDRMTCDEYIDYLTADLPGGPNSKMAQLLRVSYTIEFGQETAKQTPYNLIYLLGYGPANQFRVFGISDERYHIHNGSSQPVLAMEARLNEAGLFINYEHRLSKVVRNPDSTYSLTFKRPRGRGVVETFDRVAFTIPFNMFRDGYGVDLRQSGFSSLKKHAIENTIMARDGKVNVLYSTRFWRNHESSGDTYFTTNPVGTNTDEDGYQASWEVSRARPESETTGILVFYSGGDQSSDNVISTETPLQNAQMSALINKYNGQLTQLLGNSASEIEMLDAHSIQYDSQPWVYGAYEAWQPGSYIGGCASFPDPYGPLVPGTACSAEMNVIAPFAGFEGQAEPFYDAQGNKRPMSERNAHFGGDATVYDAQGYMTGAVQSGNRIAYEMLEAGANLGVPVASTAAGGIVTTTTVAVAGMALVAILLAGLFVTRRAMRTRRQYNDEQLASVQLSSVSVAAVARSSSVVGEEEE